MRPIEARVEPDACDPPGDKPSILPGREAPSAADAAGEEEIAWLRACRSQVFVDCLTGLLRQLKPDRPAGLPLTYSRTIDGSPVRSNVLDHQVDDIAPSQFAIDREIEHRESR